MIHPTNADKMVQHVTISFKGSQTKNTSIAAFTCFAVIM